MKKHISARIEESTIKMLENVAKEKGIPKARLVDMALKAYLMKVAK